MRVSIRSSTLSRITGAVAALWLCGGGAAWAGGGADLASLQALIGKADGSTGLCHLFGMTSTNKIPCPQLPNITQAVLEVAALGNDVPVMIRAQNSITPQFSVDAGNAAAVPANIPVDNNTGLATLPLAKTTPNTSAVLSTLTPLAFISQSSGAGQAAQPFDSSADSFLYAVAVSSFQQPGLGGLTDPDMVYFFFDDVSRTNQSFANGQVIGKFSFPLTTLNADGTESLVVTTLQVKATCTSGSSCLQAQVISGFGATTSNPIRAGQLGINFALVFSTTPTSAQTHAVFEWAVPLLVTGACITQDAPFCLPGQTAPGPNTDPAYFWSLHHPGELNPVNTGVYTAFVFDDPPSPPPSAGSIGLAPTAGPLGPPTCTLNFSDTGQPTNYSCNGGVAMTYGLCASLPTNGNGQSPRPAVATYYAVGTSGETLLSAPFHPLLQDTGKPAFACPF